MYDVVLHRVGIGTDLHRLEPGRRLVLGGVDVPSESGAVAHSDGDVVLHAVIDAMLGAARLGDIGEHFPDNDPRYRGADSRLLAREAAERVRQAGYEAACVDVVIHAERPKLSNYKRAMAESVAGLLGLPAERVSIKAKTNEGVDAVGRGEAIACTAVAGLTRLGPSERA